MQVLSSTPSIIAYLKCKLYIKYTHILLYGLEDMSSFQWRLLLQNHLTAFADCRLSNCAVVQMCIITLFKYVILCWKSLAVKLPPQCFVLVEWLQATIKWNGKEVGWIRRKIYILMGKIKTNQTIRKTYWCMKSLFHATRNDKSFCGIHSIGAFTCDDTLSMSQHKCGISVKCCAKSVYRERILWVVALH